MGFTRYGLAKEGKIISVLAELTRGLRHMVEEKCGQNWLLIMALPIIICAIWNKLFNFSGFGSHLCKSGLIIPSL